MIPKIVYIAGYGRSGSTILDIILGNHEISISLGEMSNLPATLAQKDAGATCSCGKPLAECPHWQSILSRVDSQVIPDWQLATKIQETVESPRSLLRLIRGEYLPGGKHEGVGQQYRQQMQAILAAIASTPEKSLVVDSSKTTWLTTGRPLALVKLCHFDVKVIHLIRDGRAVMWSGTKGTNKSLAAGASGTSILRGFKIALSWALVNALTSLVVRLFPPKNVMRLHYEDLVEDPGSAIDRLATFLELDMSAVKERIVQGSELEILHLVGGNRTAQKRNIQLRADYEWKTRLPLVSHLFFWSLFWPV
nr:sulfotransferase [Ardenticatenales bacterium]